MIDLKSIFRLIAGATAVAVIALACNAAVSSPEPTSGPTSSPITTPPRVLRRHRRRLRSPGVESLCPFAHPHTFAPPLTRRARTAGNTRFHSFPPPAWW